MVKFPATRALYACLVAVYLLAFPYHPRLRSPNELCRLWQSRALVDHHTIELNQTLRDFGYVGDLSVKDGRYFPSKAPLMSFAAAPIYAVLKHFIDPRNPTALELMQVYFSRLFLTVLPTLLLLFFLRRFLMAWVSATCADIVVFSYALGTMAFSYSQAFMSHQLTSVLVFFSFYTLWRTQRQERSLRAGAMAAGAFAGAAIATEYTAALPVVLLAAWEVGNRLASPAPLPERLRTLIESAGGALLGALPFLVGLMLYHQAAFGHPLESGYKYLNDAAYQGWHVGGFLGIRLPDLHALGASFFSPLRGFFSTSPFLLLALPGILLLPKKLRWLTLLQLLGFTYFTSSFSYESWGWTTGPRHLTPLIPFLLLPVALVLQKAARLEGGRRAAAVGAGVGLCVVSIVSFGSVAMVNYIPDSLSTALFGAVVPLFTQGYFSPSLLLFLGVKNPGAGMFLFGLLCLVAVGTSHLGFQLAPSRRLGFGAAALLVTLLSLLPLSWATRHDAADLAAVEHLKNSWLAPPNERVSVWQVQ